MIGFDWGKWPYRLQVFGVVTGAILVSALGLWLLWNLTGWAIHVLWEVIKP